MNTLSINKTIEFYIPPDFVVDVLIPLLIIVRIILFYPFVSYLFMNFYFFLFTFSSSASFFFLSLFFLLITDVEERSNLYFQLFLSFFLSFFILSFFYFHSSIRHVIYFFIHITNTCTECICVCVCVA